MVFWVTDFGGGYFRHFTVFCALVAWPSGLRLDIFVLEKVGVQVQIPARLLPFFFRFFFLSSYFLSLGLVPFFLIADPF